MDLVNKLLNALVEELQNMATEAEDGENSHVVLADLVQLFNDVRDKLAQGEQPEQPVA